MKPVIKFSYLGDRDYLDITSILDSLWAHFGLEFRTFVKGMEFKIISPVVDDCFLYYCKTSEVAVAEAMNAVAEFSWLIEETKFSGYLIPTGQKISSRIEESKWDFDDHCSFKDNCVVLNKSFKEDVCYNLTKMGKFLISKFRDPDVRIVKFYFKELLPTRNMVGSKLRMIDLQKKGFIKIICENNDIEFGHILVKSKSKPDLKNKD